jgi:hypothetical protein
MGPLSWPSGGVIIGGVSHTLKHLDNMLGQKFDLPMPRVNIFIVALAAPLLKKSLIIQHHIGLRGRKMLMIIRSGTVKALYIHTFGVSDQGQTLDCRAHGNNLYGQWRKI